MTGRERVFSHPDVIHLIREHFIPVVEDVSDLQTQRDAKGEFFRAIAVQDHMKGRSRPGVSHQGVYAFTPDGISLRSANPLDADRMLDLLQTALQRWQESGEVGAALGETTDGAPSAYPEDGLVLKLYARDLPRPEGAKLPPSWAANANRWNQDFAWFTREEARAMVPAPRLPGAEINLPRAVVARIARFHLRDIVRGEPGAWPREALNRARLTSRIDEIDGSRLTLTLDGEVSLACETHFEGAHDHRAYRFDTGFDATLRGVAVWDDALEAFVAFDLLATGPRWGAWRYNGRLDDPGPAPLAIAFELAGRTPWERMPPHVVFVGTIGEGRYAPAGTTVTGEP